jgi:glycosyltransferase involved in cell wall biosynthesis
VYSRRILHGVAALGDRPVWFCYRPHRMLRSLVEPLPRNASRRLLRADGPWPGRCGIFHALNQRVDRRFAPTVTTFHDLFVLTGEYSSPEFRERFAGQARRAAANSDLIIAVSQFTADQVIALLNVERSRVRVVHHGATLPPVAPPPDSDRENLVLCVGAMQTRKNTARLVEAFDGMPPGWTLALAGATDGYGAHAILKRIEANRRRSDIELLGYVNGRDLESLYRRARIFAFPSLDEGFGMPVLDAMARGVPVITSNRSALPEVAGDAALLVDPDRTDEIAAALQRVATDLELRTDLARRGLQRAATFTWEKAVSQTRAAYFELSS